uniref:Uncharacterized protein n=1 Tax=Arundo donax TaxID=35708 RepID=A0A0A9AYJ0_ARUDO
MKSEHCDWLDEEGRTPVGRMCHMHSTAENEKNKVHNIRRKHITTAASKNY